MTIILLLYPVKNGPVYGGSGVVDTSTKLSYVKPS